jgi:hypothetical protein
MLHKLLKLPNEQKIKGRQKACVGTGSLAFWASSIGQSTKTNEIDPHRREFTEILSFKQINYNEESTHDFLR